MTKISLEEIEQVFDKWICKNYYYLKSGMYFIDVFESKPEEIKKPLFKYYLLKYCCESGRFRTYYKLRPKYHEIYKDRIEIPEQEAEAKLSKEDKETLIDSWITEYYEELCNENGMLWQKALTTKPKELTQRTFYQMLDNKTDMIDSPKPNLNKIYLKDKFRKVYGFLK